MLAIELAKLGFPFAQAVPRTTRDADGAAHRCRASSIDQGPRTYVERIDIHGNTRTRDYVIRREFDLAEGDAYNKTLIDRAERRLKNLNYFKSVKITHKPGSASDRVVLDVERGGAVDRRLQHRRRLFDDRRPARRGQAGRPQFPGHRRSGQGLRHLRPIRARRRPVGIRAVFPRHPRRGGHRTLRQAKRASPYQSYGSDIYGATLQFGTPITEQLGVQYRYSLYNQDVTLDPTSLAAAPSLPIQQAALAGPQWVSAVGDTVTYNTLDNTKNPTSGFNSQLRQDLAGLGGDVKFLRTTEDVRYYQSINSDLDRHGARPGRLHHRLGRPAGAADQQLLRRPDHGAGICAQRFRAARPHARHDHG